MINLLAKDIEGGVAGGPVAVQAQYLVLIPPIYDDDDDDGDIDDDCGDNGDIDYEDHYGRYIFSWPPVKYSLKEIFFLTYLNLNSVLHDDDDDDDDEDLLDGQASFQVSSCTIETSPPSNSLTVFRNLKCLIFVVLFFLKFRISSNSLTASLLQSGFLFFCSLSLKSKYQHLDIKID